MASATPQSESSGPPYFGMKLPSSYLAEGGETTFQYQDSLPSLPAPALNHTLAKYLESARPHLSDEEYKHTESIVSKFSEGVGKELHEKFMDRIKHKKNWLEKWWEDYAYLNMRGPHSPYVNFTGPAPYSDSHWPPKAGSQIERAGLIIWFALRYWEVLRREQLRVDRGGRTTVWCMHQYKRMFSGCKTPGEHMDKLNDYFKTDKEGPTSTHIVVFCHGRIFEFDSTDAKGDLLTAPELQAQFQYIRDLCEKEAKGPGVGALTGHDRTSWYKLREHIKELHTDNSRYLQQIETAVMAVVLDESEPNTMNEIAREGLLGDSTNRWFDKALTFIVYKNGTVSCNCDHSPFDGMIMVTILVYFYNCVKADPEWRGPKTVRNFPRPKELAFKLDQQVVRGIDDAKAVFKKADESLDIFVNFFKGFGKDYLRSFKLHPDAFVQMALQLGYYRVYGKPAPTYETASTRKYHHGRTETVRSCTNESLAWTKAMLDPTVSNITRQKLLATAMQKHIKNMMDCMENKGCDRHLFGLSVVAMEDGLPTPELYTDKSYAKSGGGGNYILSTSFVGYTPVFGGVSPMCTNGYGCFYSIQQDQLSFFVSSWTGDKDTSSSMLYNSVAKSLMDMKEVMDSTAQNKL